jgi:UDP-N-acetylmuramoyl-tripeptide--D-alanyl-D-alanine ligase
VTTRDAEANLRLGDVVSATGGRLVSGVPTRALTGVSIDSRTLSAGDLFVAIVGPRFDGHDFIGDAAQRGGAAALVSEEVVAPPGIDLVRVADTTQALAALARYARRRSTAPVVAITGSTGKTTTKEMTARLLETAGPVLRTEGNLNNQYGLPLTLLRLRPEHRFVVLELGMSAAGELRHLSGIAEPDVAAITNVAAVHLEFFASVDAIADAKAEILEGLRPRGAAVLNGDDPRVRAIGERRRDVVWFGHDRAYAVSAENWRGTVQGMRFDLVVGGRTLDIALPLTGPHFLMNFLAAAAVASHLGIEPRVIADGALNMKAVSHRGEVVHLQEQITLIDDSYNSNPFAVDAAVASLGLAGARRRVAFLGDMLELGPTARALHVDTGRKIAGRIDVLVGVGPLSHNLLEGAQAAGVSPADLHHFADSAQAAREAASLVQAGDAVLIKGSRGVRMEAVVEALRERFGTAGEGSR